MILLHQQVHFKVTASTMSHQTIDTKITACEAITGYTFDSFLLILQALNNSGYPIPYNGAMHTLPKNNALAVLGDAYTAATLCGWWFKKNSLLPLKASGRNSDMTSVGIPR
jgi:hypothetical protein